jgi:cell division septum initiation protein DivIVA
MRRARERAPHTGRAVATREVADVYRVFEALDELVTICEEARGLPMTSSCVVPRGDVLELLDDVREAIPGELDDAQDVLDHRDQLVAEATEGAEKSRSEAQTEADRILAEAREQAQQMIAEAEHEAERVVSRGRREYADLTDRAAAEADRMAEAGRQSYDRAVADGHTEQQRLVSEHQVTLAARDEAGRILDRAADDAHRARTDCDHYVDSALAEFSETLESVLDTVGRHRHQLRTGQVGAGSQGSAQEERASA